MSHSRACMYVCVHTCVYVYTCVCVCVRMCAREHASTQMCKCTYMGSGNTSSFANLQICSCSLSILELMREGIQLS